jgi:hypothetical protein
MNQLFLNVSIANFYISTPLSKNAHEAGDVAYGLGVQDGLENLPLVCTEDFCSLAWDERDAATYSFWAEDLDDFAAYS